MSTSPQHLVEHALSTSTSEHCIVIVEDGTSTNLRWANNTLTTNGVMHGVDVAEVAGGATHPGAAGQAEVLAGAGVVAGRLGVPQAKPA